MKDFLKKIPVPLLPVIWGVTVALMGLVLIIAPNTSLNVVCFCGGVVVALKAAEKLYDYLKSLKANQPRTNDLISFAVTLCIAVVLMVHPRPLLSVFPVIVGVCVLIYGIISFFTKGRTSLLGKIASAITVVIGLVVINSPMLLAEAATRISGVALLVAGVFAVASNFYAVRKLKEWDIQITPDDGYKEVEFTDVDE